MHEYCQACRRNWTETQKVGPYWICSECVEGIEIVKRALAEWGFRKKDLHWFARIGWWQVHGLFEIESSLDDYVWKVIRAFIRIVKEYFGRGKSWEAQKDLDRAIEVFRSMPIKVSIDDMLWLIDTLHRIYERMKRPGLKSHERILNVS